MKLRIAVLLFFMMNVVGVARADQTKTDVVERLQSATTALQKLAEAGIPDEVLKGAKCIWRRAPHD